MIKKYVIAVITGLIVGIITLIGQKYLPINMNFFANSASMWLIPTFLIPYILKTNKKSSIVLGISNLIFCVLGYYTFEAIFNNHSFELNRFMIFWLTCAIIGGTVFGLGANYSNTSKSTIKYIGMNLLPAVFVSEGLCKLIYISEYEHMIIGIILQIIIGLVLYTIINYMELLKKKNVLSFLCLTILGTLSFVIVFNIL